MGFKLPNIESYDGSYDPFEYINHYRTIYHAYLGVVWLVVSSVFGLCVVYHFCYLDRSKIDVSHFLHVFQIP